jgi:hypothetical protein
MLLAYKVSNSKDLACYTISTPHLVIQIILSPSLAESIPAPIAVSTWALADLLYTSTDKYLLLLLLIALSILTDTVQDNAEDTCWELIQ